MYHHLFLNLLLLFFRLGWQFSLRKKKKKTFVSFSSVKQTSFNFFSFPQWVPRMQKFRTSLMWIQSYQRFHLHVWSRSEYSSACSWSYWWEFHLPHFCLPKLFNFIFFQTFFNFKHKVPWIMNHEPDVCLRLIFCCPETTFVVDWAINIK